jgi:hypothetical protein
MLITATQDTRDPNKLVELLTEDLPEDLLADGKHTRFNGQKIYHNHSGK